MNEYEQELKRRIIKKFIKENKKAPTKSQIQFLVDQELKRYTNLNRYGFSGFDIEKVKFKEPISSSMENSNRDLIVSDLNVSKRKIENLNTSIQDNFLFANKNLKRISGFLDSLEQQLNRLILLNSSADLFLYGVEENFESLSNVDFEKTTAFVTQGYATLSKESLEIIENSEYTITSSISSNKGILGNVEIEPASSLKAADGVYYKNVIQAQTFDDAVQLNLFFAFKKRTYIGEVKIVGDSIESNSKCYYNVSYSTANESYKEIKPKNKRFSSGENYTSVGREVLGIKISLIKEKADDIDFLMKKFIYNFCLDSIEFTKNKFKKNASSVLYAGPYEIFDENGNEVNFSMATLSNNTCCIVPSKTSVSFFVSKDQENWYGLDFDKEKKSVVKFGGVVDNSPLLIIKPSEPLSSFIYEDSLAYDLLEEAMFNFNMSIEDYEKINIKNSVFERNLRDNGSLYNTDSGWFFNENTSNYSCWVYVDSIEGRTIDFGPNSCLIDNVPVSGWITLDQGYHKFETSSSNWKKISSGLDTAKQLEENDELFPYNHKYLIEGYRYKDSFRGDKVYLGVDKSFASLLKYVPPEIFYMKDNKDNLEIFTCEQLNGFYYFKVKILNSDSSWKKEKNNVIIQKQTTESNKIYVKAIIKSSDEGISPHINSFSIRVI